MGGKLLLGMGLVVALVASGSQAQAVAAAPQVIVDENGNGIFIDSSGNTSVLPVDTTVPGAPLVYKLPFLVTLGDVVLNDVHIDVTGQTTRTLSDVIRFANHDTGTANAGGELIFYSDLESGEKPDLADVDRSGFTIDTNLPQIFDEVGLEGGLNGKIYTPGMTNSQAQPGFTDKFGTTEPQYALISDGSLPLPASAWAGLALIGCLGAWRVIRRRSAVQ